MQGTYFYSNKNNGNKRIISQVLFEIRKVGAIISMITFSQQLGLYFHYYVIDSRRLISIRNLKISNWITLSRVITL